MKEKRYRSTYGLERYSCHYTRHVRAYGSRGSVPLTFNFGSRWKRVVNVTPRSLCPRELTQTSTKQGTQWRSWLTHCATSRKIAGSIPHGIIRIFHWHNPSGRTMALGSTQPLIEMSTRNISWGKGGRRIGLTTLPTSCAECLEIWEP